MGGNLFTIFATMVNFVILILILKRLLFSKINNIISNREKAIKDSLEKAEATNKLADEKLENYETKISNLEEEGRIIIRAAKETADAQMAEIVKKAKAESVGIIAHAEKEIERERHNAESEMKEQIMSIAMLAAQKIMEKELSAEGNAEVVDKILKEAGKSAWQN